MSNKILSEDVLQVKLKELEQVVDERRNSWMKAKNEYDAVKSALDLITKYGKTSRTNRGTAAPDKWPYALKALESMRGKGHYKEIHDKMIEDGWDKDQKYQSTYTFLKRRASREEDVEFLGNGIFALPVDEEQKEEEELMPDIDFLDDLESASQSSDSDVTIDDLPF